MDGRELLMQTTFAQAATFMNDGRYEEALKLLEKLLEDGWDDSELLTMTLACALYLERWELSNRLVKELEKNAIDEPEALLLMLDYALAQEDRKKGKFLLDQIKEKHPEWTWLLWDVAELLSDYGWAEEYESMLKLLTQIPSKDPWSRLDQAEAWMTLEEPAEAASAAYQAAEGLDVEHKDDLLFAAHLLEEAREMSKASEIYDRLIAAYPEEARGYLGLARVRSAQGYQEEADNAFLVAREPGTEVEELESTARQLRIDRKKVVDFTSYRNKK